MNDIQKHELQRLMDGNDRFVKGECSCHTRNLDTLRQFMTHQEPKTIILSCSDSRVIPEVIFDCGIGELFVVRTAGATIGLTFDILESLEFGVSKLKAPLLIMLGHDDCGVTKYAKDYYTENKESYTSIMSNLCPIIEEQGHLHYDEITKEHTQTLKKLLIERSMIINEAVKNGKLEIVSAHFHFDTGKISLL